MPRLLVFQHVAVDPLGTLDLIGRPERRVVLPSRGMPQWLD